MLDLNIEKFVCFSDQVDDILLTFISNNFRLLFSIFFLGVVNYLPFVLSYLLKGTVPVRLVL